MKKTLLILTTIILLCFVGCKNDTTNTSNSENKNEESSTIVKSGYFEEKSEEELIAIAEKEFEETSIALEPFELGCFSIVCDDTITDDNGMIYTRIYPDFAQSLEDIESYVKKYVTEQLSSKYLTNELLERFKEVDGSLYVLDAARGMDICYIGYEIVKVKEVNGDKAVFEIAYNYCDPDNEEDTTSEIYDFIIVKEDNEIKVDSMVYPY